MRERSAAPGHLEEHVRADAPLERRIEVGGQVGGEHHHAVERLELVQQHVHHRVGLAVVGLLRAAGRAPPRGDGVGLVEEEHRAFVRRGAEDGGHVLRRLARPHALDLGVVHHQQALAERVRDGLGADRLPGPRRAGEVEREAEPRGVALAEPPAVEDQRVAAHLRERHLERGARGRRQDHVVEGALGHHGLDGAPAAAAGEQVQEGRRHLPLPQAWAVPRSPAEP
jgi:hypothetical protein